MDFLINPPKNDIPPFIEKYYNKTVSDTFLTGLAKWASTEFLASVRYYAEKMNLNMWVKLRKLSPAYVLASLPNFITILKSISLNVWKMLDGKVIELFADAYEIWKKRNGKMKTMLAAA